MSKYFRSWNIDQTLLLPPSVQDFVPKDHVSRFIVELVQESLDLREITGSYVSGLGQPPFDPRMMVALLLHSYASGLYSSRRIAKACRERNDFVMIVALDPPDFRTISDFRKRHLKALGALFLQVLKLCETAGLVKLGHVALDGTKIKANASKHKAMSYERMKKREAELKAEVARMLAAAEAADAQEDETFGQDKRGDEMPDWVGDKQKRLAKIQQAMAALEADARLAAGGEGPIGGEKGTAAPSRRPQEAGQTGGAAIGPTCSQVATQLHRSGKPHHEVEGWLRSGLQCTGRRRRRRPDHCRARTHPVRQRSGPVGAPGRGHREQSRPQAGAGLGGLRLLQRNQSRSARSTGYRRLCRARTRQAPDSREWKNWRTADPTDAKKDRRWRLRNALPIEKASGGTGVRTDQTGARLPPVPVARHRKSANRVGHDLHRPQPPQAVHPRKGRLSRLLSNKRPVATPYLDGLLATFRRKIGWRWLLDRI